MELIAYLSTGKGTWGHVSRMVQDGDFEKVYLITNDYGKENYTADAKTELIAVNSSQGLKELRDEIRTVLKEKVKGAEVVVNFVSGTGKEHMALMSALLKLGVGIRFMALTKDGVEEI
ncbi:MAG: hypothetical protein ABIJ20_02215 [Nanoarchaeota archaeon]|nr:hypothetical protein [Nanoarchaeota archaeon]MBU1445617.1 hypothetical protein [Nanoarchaeota archaeon]MBU2406921.1 hypothetical protein [Nanoarchaeota archaeon]MBU2420809.1 hypothetical protein [Nanoarchaeota archaeon]MBU2475648.1 hypothetical protein [Nanoarchaeota archaeon]